MLHVSSVKPFSIPNVLVYSTKDMNIGEVIGLWNPVEEVHKIPVTN